jgi:hypothetical protein
MPRASKLSKDQIKVAADRAEGVAIEDGPVEASEPASPLSPAKHKGGRPTKYRAEYAAQAEKLCRLGAVDADLADFFNVTISTVGLWKVTHAEFSAALKAGKEEADARVERSLYQRANGYSHDAVKLFLHQGEVIRAEYREHYPPDTTAAIFWLKNRRPDLWRDRQVTELTGKDGGAIDVATRVVIVPPKVPAETKVEVLTRDAG